MGGPERGRSSRATKQDADSARGERLRIEREEELIVLQLYQSARSGGLGALFGREAGCGRGRDARKAAGFERPSTSGHTLSKHPLGTTLVPRDGQNITLTDKRLKSRSAVYRST